MRWRALEGLDTDVPYGAKLPEEVKELFSSHVVTERYISRYLVGFRSSQRADVRTLSS